jgi:hypothetical protein
MEEVPKVKKIKKEIREEVIESEFRKEWSYI